MTLEDERAWLNRKLKEALQPLEGATVTDETRRRAAQLVQQMIVRLGGSNVEIQSVHQDGDDLLVRVKLTPVSLGEGLCET